MKLFATVLVPRRQLLLVAFFVEAALLGGFVLSLYLSPRFQGREAFLIEILAGTLIITIIISLFGFIRWLVRNDLLEAELRRARAVSLRDDVDDIESPILTTLGSSINQYNRELNASRIVKTGRIEVQRRLLQTILRQTGERIIVLSGSGTLLYTSDGWYRGSKDEESNTSEDITFSPVPSSLVAHLIAGKGQGTVSVNGDEMYYSGIFGNLVVGDAEPGLAYILIADNAPEKIQESPLLNTARKSRRGVMRWFRSL